VLSEFLIKPNYLKVCILSLKYLLIYYIRSALSSLKFISAFSSRFKIFTQDSLTPHSFSHNSGISYGSSSGLKANLLFIPTVYTSSFLLKLTAVWIAGFVGEQSIIILSNFMPTFLK